MEHLRIWRYRVEDAQRTEFIRHYSAEGSWVQMFRQSAGYLGTRLWQDTVDANVFYTLDRWRREEDFALFQQIHSQAYREMDKQLEGLTAEETFLGACNEIA